MCGDELRFLLAVVHITTFICPYARWPQRQSRVFQNPSKRRDKGDAKRLLAGLRSFHCSLIGRPGLVLDCPMVRLFVPLCSTPGRCCRLSLAGAGAKYELSSATERYASLGPNTCDTPYTSLSPSLPAGDDIESIALPDEKR